MTLSIGVTWWLLYSTYQTEQLQVFQSLRCACCYFASRPEVPLEQLHAMCVRDMHTLHCCWFVTLALVSSVTVRGSCENASVFDKSNGIFAVKQNSYRYTVSTVEGREMNLIFYFHACVSWAQCHVLCPRMSSTAGFYGAVSHNWITFPTVDLTCIAHLRIRSLKCVALLPLLSSSYRTSLCRLDTLQLCSEVSGFCLSRVTDYPDV